MRFSLVKFLSTYKFARSAVSMSTKRLSDSGSITSEVKKQKTLQSFFKKVETESNVENGEIAILVPKPVKTGSSATASSWLTDLLTEKSWRTKLRAEFSKPYFADIEKFLSAEYANGKQIFPPKHLIFNAFNLTPLDEIKVVILGQDPYHDNGQAHGLSFSVPLGKEPPPSLKNIYKELQANFDGYKPPRHGCLEKWAKSGVLLLNATLTVQAHNANSHSTIGWQNFTDSAIKVINRECSGVVFLLWGGFAHKKEKLIDPRKHTILKTAHPSPLSATRFFGCRCFTEANDVLQRKYSKEPVDWSLD